MKKDLEAALADLPLFPLSQVVLFPRALLPLHVFEPRYRTLLKDVLATHGTLAVVLVPDTRDVDERGQPRIATVAGAGEVVEHQELPDGRSNILVRGLCRVRLAELPLVPPYRRARATVLEEVDGGLAPADRTALVAAASAFSAEVHKRDPNFSFRLPANVEVSAICDLCAHHLVIDAAARQAILEQLDVAARVQMVIRELSVQQRALSNEPGEGTLN